MSTATIIVLIIAILAIAGGLFLFVERQKTRRLRSTFGPEYDRLVDQEGNPHRVAAILDQREKRMKTFDIHPLSADQRSHFESAWRATQEHFVDDPRGAIEQADYLIHEALRTRGYPVSDFEQEAADLSVEYPAEVSEYRAAHDIAVRDSQGTASTEDLRLAMQHYRNLFENLLNRQLINEEVHQ